MIWIIILFLCVIIFVLEKLLSEYNFLGFVEYGSPIHRLFVWFSHLHSQSSEPAFTSGTHYAASAGAAVLPYSRRNSSGYYKAMTRDALSGSGETTVDGRSAAKGYQTLPLQSTASRPAKLPYSEEVAYWTECMRAPCPEVCRQPLCRKGCVVCWQLCTLR